MTYKCPACGHADPTQTPRSTSNSASSVSLDIPEHMVPAVARALLIGSTTAMMSQRKEEEDYLREASKTLFEQSPWAATVFEPHAWAVIATRIGLAGDVVFKSINTGSTWRPVWKISAAAEGDADWPQSRRGKAPLSLTSFEEEKEANVCADRLREEAARLSPL